MKIGSTIKKLREYKKITQKEVIDDELVCTERNYINIENDKQITNIETLYKISDNVGVEISDVMYEFENDNHHFYRQLVFIMHRASLTHDYSYIKQQFMLLTNEMFNELSKVQKQTILMYKASVAFSYDREPELAKELATEALNMSYRPDSMYFTDNELGLLNILMAITWDAELYKEYLRAFELSEQRLQECNSDLLLKLINGISIYNLHNGIWEQTILLTNKGIAYAKMYGREKYKINYMFIKGVALYKSKPFYLKEKAISLMKEAIHLSVLHSFDRVYAEFMKDLEKFNIDIE